MGKMGVPANETVLVAVSTGCDSMTLLSLLQRLPEKMRPTVQVAYVDHQLREQSKKETDFITKYCQKTGLSYLRTFGKKSFTRKKASRNQQENSDTASLRKSWKKQASNIC